MPVAPVARRHNAVEKVDAASDRFYYVCRCTDTHQIPRLILRHVLLDGVDRVIHLLRRLTDCKSPNGVSRKIKLRYRIHMPFSEIGKCRPLIYPKQDLPGIHRIRQSIEPFQLIPAPFQPSKSTLARGFHILVRRRYLDALVKRHRDIGAEVGLYPHAVLGRHEYAPTVDMA